jgi:hypothetical protein
VTQHRVVALGASNLTRGFRTFVSTARGNWGSDVEILVALGLGRSYGAPSRLLIRTLPGILQSGVWQHLDGCPHRPTRALVTDVGNDILYGAAPAQILAWVEECVARLQRHTNDIVLTDLPMNGIRALSRSKFLLFRTILVPQCRLSFSQVVDRSEQVTVGLEALALERGLGFLRLRPEWYGFDPIHIRPGRWRTAWREILAGEFDHTAGRGLGWLETLRLYSLFPERQWLLGREHVTPQSGVPLRSGGRVWLY